VKRLLRSTWSVLSSRSVTPLVICFFLLVYIVVAFYSDETLTALMALTRGSVLLSLVLALLPLNIACRIVTETGQFLQRRRALAGEPGQAEGALFDEEVELPEAAPLDRLQGRLEAQGYATSAGDGVLAAWRGVTGFPARLLFLVAVLCLFGGILISLTSRDFVRGNVVEKEPLPIPSGEGTVVDHISLEKGTGAILSKVLTIGTLDSGGQKRLFGIYPPSKFGGAFVYPRYLGIGLLFSFSAPDLPQAYQTHAILALYPPGREASAEVPGTPYRLVFTLAQPVDGSDPYMTGRLNFHFNILKGKEQLYAGSAPAGGEFVRDGFRLALPDARRVVITDFITDYGVWPIWLSSILFPCSLLAWLLFRLFLPRRELLFVRVPGAVRAYSRAEGRGRGHGEVFHEALDYLVEGKGEARSVRGEEPTVF
jgi:hypothetical protein